MDTAAVVAAYMGFLGRRERENMLALLRASTPAVPLSDAARVPGATLGASSEEQLRAAVHRAQQTVLKLRREVRVARERERGRRREREPARGSRLAWRATHHGPLRANWL